MALKFLWVTYGERTVLDNLVCIVIRKLNLLLIKSLFGPKVINTSLMGILNGSYKHSSYKLMSNLENSFISLFYKFLFVMKTYFHHDF